MISENLLKIEVAGFCPATNKGQIMLILSETARSELTHLNLHNVCKNLNIAFGAERVNVCFDKKKHWFQ